MISEFTGELTETPLLISGSQPIRNIEADIVVTADEGSAVQFILAESPQAQERTTISYDSRQQELVVDTLASSLDPLAEGRRKSSPLPLQPGEALELRLFLDGSVLEVYANHRVVITSRLYPTSTNHLRFFACAPRREGDLASGRLYRLGSCQR
jgi:beta-fructofuranosidase